MARLLFTPQLQRFTAAPEVHSTAQDLRSALQDAFNAHPRLQGYILDEQGHLRPNVVIFIDGQRVRDHRRLDDAIHEHSQIHVWQALSGG